MRPEDRVFLDQELDLALGTQIRVGARIWKEQEQDELIPHSLLQRFSSCPILPTYSTSGGVYHPHNSRNRDPSVSTTALCHVDIGQNGHDRCNLIKA